MLKVKSIKLKNDFKIIYGKDSSTALVCLQLFIRMGSNWEKPNEAGYSHFLEHLVFKSTHKFPQNSVMEYVTNLGGSMNAYTEYDSTCFYLTLPSKFLTEGLEVLAQLILHSNFNEEEFEFEKKVVIEELKEYQNNPEEAFLDNISKEYFVTNPYKNPIIGNIQNLNNAKIEDLKKFYEKYHSPNNSFLVATGDFYDLKLLKIIEKYFGNWKKTKIKKQQKVKKDFPDKFAVTSYQKKISNDLLAFVLPDLSDNDSQAYPLSLITKVFATEKNSRLHQRLFADEKLVDGIKVHSLSGINDGATVILVMPKKNANIDIIVKIFLEELEQFYLYGLNKIELEEHKKELNHFHRYSFEYMESLASNLGSEELALGYEEFFQYPKKINALNIQDVNEVIKEYFKSKYLHIYHCGATKKSLLEAKKYLGKKDAFTSIPKIKQNFFETKLENGMKILLKKVKGKPTVGISLSYEVSQLNENIQNRGINAFTSGLMLYGNKKRDYKQFLKFCSTNGISFGINARSETTTVYAKCFTEMLSMTLELISEVILYPTFPKDYLENLQTTYKSNLDRIKDYPEYYAGKLWEKMLFGNENNLMNKFGNKTSIDKISVKKITNWYKKYYNPRNLSLAIVGDFDFDEALFICEKNFVFSENGFIKSQQVPIFESNKKRFKKLKNGSAQAIINIGGFGCKGSDFKKNTAFHILSAIIGGDTDSRLFNEIREKRGLGYSVGMDFHMIRSLGYWNISAVVDKKNEQQTIDIIFSVLENVKKNEITTEELQRAKNYILGQRLIADESVLSQAQTLSVLEAIGYGYEHYKKRDERLMNVDLKILHQLAEEYFKEENYFVYLLS